MSYYAFVVAILWPLTIYFPHWLQVMPFGGLDQYENMNTASTVIDLGEIKLYEQPHHLFADSLNLITAMIGVFMVMIPIRWGFHLCWQYSFAWTSPYIHPLKMNRSY